MPAEPSDMTLDPDWIAAFEAQLAIQRATVSTIRSATQDALDYCAESGKTPIDAFGDPRSYAATLSGSYPIPNQRSWFSRSRLPALSLIAEGLFISTFAAFASTDGTVGMSAGALVAATVAIPAWVVGTSRFAEPSPRDPRAPDRAARDESGWRGLIAVATLAAVVSALCLGLRNSLSEIPTWGAFVTGAMLFAAGLAVQWLARDSTSS